MPNMSGEGRGKRTFKIEFHIVNLVGAVRVDGGGDIIRNDEIRLIDSHQINAMLGSGGDVSWLVYSLCE